MEECLVHAQRTILFYTARLTLLPSWNSRLLNRFPRGLPTKALMYSASGQIVLSHEPSDHPLESHAQRRIRGKSTIAFAPAKTVKFNFCDQNLIPNQIRALPPLQGSPRSSKRWVLSTQLPPSCSSALHFYLVAREKRKAKPQEGTSKLRRHSTQFVLVQFLPRPLLWMITDTKQREICT